MKKLLIGVLLMISSQAQALNNELGSLQETYQSLAQTNLGVNKRFGASSRLIGFHGEANREAVLKALSARYSSTEITSLRVAAVARVPQQILRALSEAQINLPISARNAYALDAFEGFNNELADLLVHWPEVELFLAHHGSELGDQTELVVVHKDLGAMLFLGSFFKP